MTTQGKNPHDNDNGKDSNVNPLDDIDSLDSVPFDSDLYPSDEGNDVIPPWTDGGVAPESIAADSETKSFLKVVNTKKQAAGDFAEQIRQDEPNIIARARALAKNALINFKDVRAVRVGEQIIQQAQLTDTNRIVVLDAIFGKGDSRPHIDTFSGRLIDQNRTIVDDRYPMVDMLHAMDEAGLKGQSIDAIRKTFKEWGLLVQSNDLIKRIDNVIPEWDGKGRARKKIINLFGCRDTELSREFGLYFWLSLYCRIIFPGCMAPMALSLFGAQNAGKSYFSKLICQVLLGDDKSDSVQLDLSGDVLEFLRDITGFSLIANVGEMTGFGTADMNRIKAFMTRTTDKLHYKYEGHFNQPRQWIVVMDGNKYEGLQRDASGNRRFYPMFVGQIDDIDGQPAWELDFKADFTGFADDLWQIMAECRAWIEKNGGLEGYRKFVDKVSKDVAEFNNGEMQNNRGTPRDQALDSYLTEALLTSEKDILNKRKNQGVFIKSGRVISRIKELSRGITIMDNRLKLRMISLGAREVTVDNTRGYIFDGCMTDMAFCDIVTGRNKADYDHDVVEPVKVNRKTAEAAGGF